jgi:xanthine dehydrogenase YagS FAD-binding subunit
MTMHPFTYIDAATSGEVLPLLGAESQVLAGGTDLLPLMKAGLATPAMLVDIKHAEALHVLHEDETGLHIGALTTLTELDQASIVRARYPALADAAGQAASPQLRNRATLGGNLLQQVRCWYYRGDFPCWMKGGHVCHARSGENQFHAIWDRSPCVAVHPSDPPTALLAFDATVRIAGPGGERSIALGDLLQPPREERRQLHTLGADELILEVVVPPPAGHSVYLKAMDRAAWAYALASVAATARVEGTQVHNVRIVVGGVANVPLRLPHVEELVEGRSMDEERLRGAGDAAVVGAIPLDKNGYKVPLVRNLVTEALRQLVGRGSNI